jgi:hypothetical protein
MELLPRYLTAVRAQLPSGQADDIIAELSDSIQSRMEEKEEEAGHALTVDEEADVLREYGPPLLAASRYWKQQYLIGPGLLPYYWRTLKIALIVMLALNVAIDGVVAIAKADAITALVNFWGTIWGTIFVVSGIITIVFALLERYRPDAANVKWNPRSLPAVREERVPRIGSAIELAVNAAVAIWLVGSQSFRSFLVGPSVGSGISYLSGLPFNVPWLHRLAEVVLVTAAIQAVLAAATLVRPDWYRLRAAVMVFTNLVLVFVAGSIIATGPLVTPGVGPSHVGDVVAVARILNWTALASLLGICLGCTITIAVSVRQLILARDRATLNLGITDGARS